MEMKALVSYDAPGIVRFHWNRPQSQFKQIRAVPGGPLQAIDYEGAVRAGKTTAPASKASDYIDEWPGIHLCISRWKDTDLWAQTVPAWREMAQQTGVQLRWHPDEQYDECVHSGSRVYIRSLHTNELDSRYSKLAGMTLAVWWIDQPEEVPKDVIESYFPARLSQPNYPHELWLTPNPVDETDHWVAEWFPIDPAKRKGNYHLIQTSLYDNIAGVGEQYIRDMEERYPLGHALRRRFIDGQRGLSVVGTPVYAGAFSRSLHVSESVAFNPGLPLGEAWDFGHHHPAVLWSQYGEGTWHVLGEVMGQDQFIDDFAPWVLQQRVALFGNKAEAWVCCDPAGARIDNQGLKNTAVGVLNAFGIHPRSIEGSNSPTMRDAAIPHLSGALMRLHRGVPAVQAHPRCRVFIDGLEAGYVWDDRAFHNSISPNTRRPLKDGRYDHLQNCAEYSWLNFGSAYLTRRGVAAQQRAIQGGVSRPDYDRSDYKYGKNLQMHRGRGQSGSQRQRGGW